MCSFIFLECFRERHNSSFRISNRYMAILVHKSLWKLTNGYNPAVTIHTVKLVHLATIGSKVKTVVTSSCYCKELIHRCSVLSWE